MYFFIIFFFFLLQGQKVSVITIQLKLLCEHFLVSFPFSDVMVTLLLFLYGLGIIHWLWFGARGCCGELSACQVLCWEEYDATAFFLLALGSPWSYFYPLCFLHWSATTFYIKIYWVNGDCLAYIGCLSFILFVTPKTGFDQLPCLWFFNSPLA